MQKSEKIIKCSLEFAKEKRIIDWYQKIDQAMLGGGSAFGFARGSAPIDFIFIRNRKFYGLEVKECKGKNFNLKSRMSELQKEIMKSCNEIAMIVMFYNGNAISNNSKEYYEYWNLYFAKDLYGYSLIPENGYRLATIENGIKTNVGKDWGLSGKSHNAEKGIKLF